MFTTSENKIGIQLNVFEALNFWSVLHFVTLIPSSIWLKGIFRPKTGANTFWCSGILYLVAENVRKNIFRQNWGMCKKYPIFKYKWKYKGKSH